jgi:hypothetical protein
MLATRLQRSVDKAYIIHPAPADELLAGAYPGTPDDAG